MRFQIALAFRLHFAIADLLLVFCLSQQRCLVSRRCYGWSQSCFTCHFGQQRPHASPTQSQPQPQSQEARELREGQEESGQSEACL